MSRIVINSSRKGNVLVGENDLKKRLNELSKQVGDVRSGLRYKISASQQISASLNKVTEDIIRESAAVQELQGGFSQIFNLYEQAERENTDRLTAGHAELVKADMSAGQSIPEVEGNDSLWSKILELFLGEFGIPELLAGSNYVGKIYKLYQDLRNGASWKDFGKWGVDVYQFLSGAAKTFNNYKRIGNAVGTKTAMSWWAKNALGLKPLGRVSAAKDPFTRFKNNLINKTSPFNAQIKNVVGNFTGANGIGTAVASWGAVAVDGVLNWFSNKEEQANSGGKMSDGRVVAETITETAVGTALTYGSSIVAGAAISALLPVAAPGVLVVAASGAVVAGVNAGIKALTGKSATEWVSDAILDTGEAIGKAVGKAAKNVKDTVCGWFKKLSFA